MKINLKDKSSFMFIGDSITDCGRREERHAPLGCGYVQMFADMLTIREPQKSIKISNRGIGGNTVDDLKSRWYEDVLSQKIDYLSIKIGINDLNQSLNQKEKEYLKPAGFKKIYDTLLDITVKEKPNCEILLITPFFMSLDNIEGSYRNKVRNILPEYVNIVKDLSEKYNTKLLNMQEIFEEQLKYQHPDIYCIEPVHPNSAGHFLIAESVYKKLSNEN